MAATDTGFSALVELYGGPLDGVETEVKLRDPELNVYLFPWHDPAGQKRVLAYAWCDRSTAAGLWVLRFLYEVAKMGGSSKEGKP